MSRTLSVVRSLSGAERSGVSSFFLGWMMARTRACGMPTAVRVSPVPVVTKYFSVSAS